MSDYLVWAHALVTGACALDSMKGFEDDWKLQSGERLGALPKGALFQFDAEDRGVRLSDSLHNVDRLVVASARLRDLLEAAAVPQVEFLPVPILNHQKRPVTEPYFVVNLLSPVDCLDLDACEPRWSRLDKTEIARVKRLVIDPARIDPARTLFRPKSYRACMLVHRTLAKRIDAAGLTGMRWLELDQFPEV